MSETSAERRSAMRYPIGRNVVIRTPVWRGNQSAGVGRTLNISSRGMLVETDLVLSQGDQVELAIDWPAQLNRDCGLNLMVSGDVVRSLQGAVAVQIRKYQFRTRPVGSARRMRGKNLRSHETRVMG